MAISALSLLVLRARDPQELAHFYGKLGLDFVREQHGPGPIHHSCRAGTSTLEIYPLENDSLQTVGTRLGFSVDCIETTIAACHGKIISAPRQTVWGKRAVIEDPEGHKIELVEDAPSNAV